MQKQIDNILNEAKKMLDNVMDSNELENFRVKFLGKKSELMSIMKSLGKLTKEERKVIGKTANLAKKSINDLIENRKEKIKEIEIKQKFENEKVDVTLPGYTNVKGGLHPVNTVLNEIEEIFLGMGFDIAEGPEIENDYYNFEALNIPAHHPARDMHDTFYVSETELLRTHTSPVQVRVMEKVKPPVKIIAPGKVYRRDSDVSHIPMFHQVEGLWVDENITFANLKYVLEMFLKKIFNDNIKLRFRPSYFPFTEPSTEVDMSCVICGAKGCRVCKGTGWLEILGAGMVDPEVFKFVGYDSEKYSGFAFGLGVDRIAMLKYGINDIRLMPENDIRFLKQF